MRLRWGQPIVASIFASAVTSLLSPKLHCLRPFAQEPSSIYDRYCDPLLFSAPTEPHPHRPSHSRRDHVYSLDLFTECWNQTSWTLPYGHFMRPIADGLVSPVPQSFFALQRALDMDASKASIACHYLLKRDRTLIVRSGSQGKRYLDPNGDWSILKDSEETCPDGWRKLPSPGALVDNSPDEDSSYHGLTTHQISVMILDEAIAAANQTDLTHRAQIIETQNQLVDVLKERLFWTLGTELRGRTAADTALTLALAGIVDNELYATLYHLVFLELERRKGRNVKDVLHTIEKAAASGAPADHPMFQSARECLESQQIGFDILERVKGEMSLLADDRPPLWLWRFASRFPRPPVSHAPGSLNGLTSRFANPGKPLVVDLGCGFGLTLLGLACQSQSDRASKGNANQVMTTENCNYLGCDCNLLNVNYGRGIAHRWKIDDHLQYVCSSVSEFLTELIETKTPVKLVLMQFPTPYRLQDEGNQQLPPSSDESFMASRAAIHQIAQLNAGAILLVQSNCEDVAVQVFQWAKEEGMEAIPVPDPVRSPSPFPTERTKRWLELHDGPIRAVGPCWSSGPILPKARSETEVACTIRNIPIHRCLFRVT